MLHYLRLRGYIAPVFSWFTSLLCCFGYFVSVCRADVPDRSQLLQQDPRLAKTVTISHASARIGEVLEEAEKQTGVHLYASDKDGAAGELFTVFVKDLPLADLMTGLWSLLSYQNAAWEWHVDSPETEKNKSAKPFAYRLLRPNAARDFPLETYQNIQAYLDKQLQVNILSLDASADEVKKNQELFPEIKAFAPENKDNKLDRERLRAFVSLIPKSERSQLTRDGSERIVPVSQWTPQAREYIAKILARDRLLNPSLNLPDPQKIIISCKYVGAKATPTMWFGADTCSGYSLGGGIYMEDVWQKKIAAQWLLPGDDYDDAKRNLQPVGPPKLGKPENRRIGDKVLTVTPGAGPENVITRLEHLHKEAADLPILARLTDANINIAPGGKDATIATAVGGLRKNGFPCMVKWRNGTLLVTYAAWLRNDADHLEKEKAPWEAVREFRASVVADPEEAPKAAALAQMGRALTVDQLRGLSRQQNLMPGITITDFGAQIADDVVFWSEIARRPGLQAPLQTAEGVSVRRLTQPMQEWAKQILAVDALPANVFLRLEQADVVEANPWIPDQPVVPLTPEQQKEKHAKMARMRQWYLRFFTPAQPVAKSEAAKKEIVLREKNLLWYAHPRWKPLAPASTTAQ